MTSPPDTLARELAARELHTFIAGTMYEWIVHRRAYDLAAAAPALVDARLAGLQASPPRRVLPTPPPR